MSAPMTLEEARRIVRMAAMGSPHDDDIPTGTILRALCVLADRNERG